MRCVHREPRAPSAEEARAVRYPSLAILRTVGHRANALQLRSPARSRERNVDPTTRGARRGSVFTTTARPHPRNASSFGSRSALTQRRRGPIRIELGGGAPHLSRTFIACFSESGRPGSRSAARALLAEARRQSASIEDVQTQLSKKSTRCVRSTPRAGSACGSDSLHGASLASVVRVGRRRRSLPGGASALAASGAQRTWHERVLRRTVMPGVPLRPEHA